MWQNNCSAIAHSPTSGYMLQTLIVQQPQTLLTWYFWKLDAWAGSYIVVWLGKKSGGRFSGISRVGVIWSRRPVHYNPIINLILCSEQGKFPGGGCSDVPLPHGYHWADSSSSFSAGKNLSKGLAHSILGRRKEDKSCALHLASSLREHLGLLLISWFGNCLSWFGWLFLGAKQCPPLPSLGLNSC